MRVWRLRLKVCGRSVARLRLRRPAESPQYTTEIAMCLGIGGPDRDSPAKRIAGLVELAQRRKGHAQIAVRLREVWFDGDGLGNQLNRLQGTALLVAQETEEMQSVGILGLCRQRLKIQGPCPIQLACLMVAQSLSDKLRARGSGRMRLLCCRSSLLPV